MLHFEGSSNIGTIYLTEAGAYPQLPTQPKKKMFGFKLIQQSNMVILSCLAKKNQNLNARKKKFSLLLKVSLSSQKRPQTSLFSNKLNFFSSNSNFDFFLRGNSE